MEVYALIFTRRSDNGNCFSECWGVYTDPLKANAALEDGFKNLLEIYGVTWSSSEKSYVLFLTPDQTVIELKVDATTFY